MFNFQLSADEIDRLALVVGLVLLFLYGAGARLRFERVRFSLRTLLFAMTLVAVALGAIVYKWRG